METPKEQAIKAAYGEYWIGLSNEQQKYALENEGWIKVTPSQYQMDMFSRLKLNKNKHSVRPKSITGIENNRGWTRIESEEDLPKGNGFAGFLLATVDKVSSNVYNYKEVEFYFNAGIYTHYQRIEKPKPPIF